MSPRAIAPEVKPTGDEHPEEVSRAMLPRPARARGDTRMSPGLALQKQFYDLQMTGSGGNLERRHVESAIVDIINGRALVGTEQRHRMRARKR